MTQIKRSVTESALIPVRCLILVRHLGPTLLWARGPPVFFVCFHLSGADSDSRLKRETVTLLNSELHELHKLTITAFPVTLYRPSERKQLHYEMIGCISCLEGKVI